MLQTRKMFDVDRDQAQRTADYDQRPVTVYAPGGSVKRVVYRVRPRYRYLNDVKKRNAAADFHFFEPATMRFFSSRVQSGIYVAKDGRAFFVSSERDRYQDRQPQRLYSVRVAEVNGDIETVGEFQGYTSGRAAHAARLAAKS